MAQNTGAAPRTGTITVGGRTFTVTQQAGGPTVGQVVWTQMPVADAPSPRHHFGFAAIGTPGDALLFGGLGTGRSSLTPGSGAARDGRASRAQSRRWRPKSSRWRPTNGGARSFCSAASCRTPARRQRNLGVDGHRLDRTPSPAPSARQIRPCDGLPRRFRERCCSSAVSERAIRRRPTRGSGTVPIGRNVSSRYAPGPERLRDDRR
ncbi:MAG: hypothetical protein MZV70_19705 [Desulfobacterales bacterium]|nr:hypothetical protein [Desulfobacterales bacterium]